jgi:DNA-binding transcriptional regulator YdaS (Cro superfamily)
MDQSLRTTLEQARAKALQSAGGPAALAARLDGITPQAISQWKVIPAGRVLEVERITGVSRHELRPDVFGNEPEHAA